VAGMGADLFESYVGSIIAAMAIGFTGVTIGGVTLDQTSAVMFPMLLAAGGILCSIVGTFFVRVRKGARIGDLHAALNKGVFGASILIAIVAYFLVRETLGFIEVFYAMLAGLIAGLAIGLSAEYFTESRYSPVKSIAVSSQTGPATNVISGFSVGMISTAVPIIAVCVAIGFAFHFAGFYGIAIAGVGMLSTLGMTLATDTYGPVADNAAGIAEMTGMGQKVRVRAERLDAVGNTTAAIGKGFAIGSAALTALALFSAYSVKMGGGTPLVLEITNFKVLIGLFIGGMLPFVFSALTMRAVGKGASLIVMEVRRQFRQIPGLMRGKTKPDYNRCIGISTAAALRNMVLPTLLAVVTPLAVGLILGPETLGGLLAGAIVTGFLLAITLANSGGAWDNAKKYIEEGRLGGKGSETHAASVIGDTVGDPFKDTSGPSLNILIKLMAMAALLFAPLL